jgi:hypothetical protein
MTVDETKIILEKNKNNTRMTPNEARMTLDRTRMTFDGIKLILCGTRMALEWHQVKSGCLELRKTTNNKNNTGKVNLDGTAWCKITL